MNKTVELQTKRLILRQWKDEDYPLFARINADHDVMRYYPRRLSAKESDEMLNKLRSLILQRGWGLWAVETIASNEFIGFVGLHEPVHDLPVTPCVEIGWRLDKKFWGYGYATEAAEESLKYAFEEIGLTEVYAFASVCNKKSCAVMSRLNMFDTGNNFQHPIIPEGSELREHVLYKLTKDQWQSAVV